ncbi:MAG: tail fiber domain-containing protein, partial [Bacteroidales bacterium]|nr:tail fiber domain-containing protein [Bacteroidales bacterium]
IAFDSEMSDIYYTRNINDTIIGLDFDFKTDTTIYWAVRAANSNGTSDYSEIRYINYYAGFPKSTAQSFAELSDINMKTDVENIEDALAKIMALQGVSFSWDTINNPNRNLSDGTHLGLIAQAVQPILPEVISTDVNGYLYIDYSSLVPVLIESIKDLKYINDSLNQRLNNLESRLDNIEQLLYEDMGDMQLKNSSEPAFQQEVTLENTKAIVLNQNVPNPFKEQTTISFQIPENIVSAKIVFIDNLGTILKQVEINDRGYGELIVYAHDLSAGHYTYYLVADGNTIEYRKMILSK